MTRKLPPGDKSISPVGIALNFAREPLHFIIDQYQRHGRFVTIPGPLYRPTFLLNEPDLLHELLVKQADAFGKPDPIKRVLASVFGNGIFFSEGNYWKSQRKLAQPAFHHHRLQTYAERMVAHTEHHLSSWRVGESRLLNREMRELTLRIVVDAIFRTELPATAEKISMAMETLGEIINAQVTNPFKAAIPDWAPLPAMKRKRTAAAELDNIIYDIIAARRNDPADKGDLISMFLAAVDEETGARMSDRQVRDEVMTMFVAGHDTTALTLTWAFMLLNRYPQTEVALQRELKAVLSGRPPSAADFPQLVYTQAIFKEALRLYPPVWLLFRVARRPVEIGNTAVKKGEVILSAPYLLHRLPEYYPDPETFRPERWLPDENGQTLEKRIHKMAYLPFSAGPRICIGNGFAMLEGTLLLATIAQQFRLHLSDDAVLEPEVRVTMIPKGEITIQLEARGSGSVSNGSFSVFSSLDSN